MERIERMKIIKAYKEIIEEMKKEYKKLLQVLEDKELTLLRLKGEQSETEEVRLAYKIKEKEVQQLRQQQLAIKHKLEEKKFLLQAQHLKVCGYVVVVTIEYQTYGKDTGKQVFAGMERKETKHSKGADRN
eukprot:TRINITY_DN2997_c0_g1_i1.p7 TRINITY_DN2997_c0_g1~~TRINITY_DN2997_c0_g1_i1.p7  ORF type:complete len:131 (+),score=32.20 TRINITY_DN2997_c0_g1_i1:3469-3861(+)